MITIKITADAKNTQAFLVRVEGELKNPLALHAELGARLENELRRHFLNRNTEPNKKGWAKTGFWQGVASDMITSVTATGATVTIGRESYFRIHFLGGTVRPTNGRKFLTIPLIAAARDSVRAADYEKDTGRKLFRVGRALMERTGRAGTAPASKPTLRTKGGYKVFNLGAGATMRPVYALATQAVIKKDPRAIPPQAELAAALQQTANAWANAL